MTARGKETDFDECWLGAPMFWSGLDSDTNQGMIQNAGLDIVSVEEVDEQDRRFLWLLARKPGDARGVGD